MQYGVKWPCEIERDQIQNDVKASQQLAVSQRNDTQYSRA